MIRKKWVGESEWNGTALLKKFGVGTGTIRKRRCLYEHLNAQTPNNQAMKCAVLKRCSSIYCILL